jgi:hypothetical protein
MRVKEIYFERHIYNHLVMGAIIAGQFPHISHLFYFLKILWQNF